jgi:glutamate-1-semialdehyde 2,1-aminomutase
VILSRKTQVLIEGLKERAAAAKIPFTTNHHTGMFGLFFTSINAVTSYADVMQCNRSHFKAFFAGMLNAGIYLAPSAYEAGFVSLAHGDEEIAKTLDTAEKVFQKTRIAS